MKIPEFLPVRKAALDRIDGLVETAWLVARPMPDESARVFENTVDTLYTNIVEQDSPLQSIGRSLAANSLMHVQKPLYKVLNGKDMQEMYGLLAQRNITTPQDFFSWQYIRLERTWNLQQLSKNIGEKNTQEQHIREGTLLLKRIFQHQLSGASQKYYYEHDTVLSITSGAVLSWAIQHERFHSIVEQLSALWENVQHADNVSNFELSSGQYMQRILRLHLTAALQKILYTVEEHADTPWEWQEILRFEEFYTYVTDLAALQDMADLMSILQQSELMSEHFWRATEQKFYHVFA